MDSTIPTTKARPSPPLEPGAARMREAILDKLHHAAALSPDEARPRDWFLATALAIRDRVADLWLESRRGLPDETREVAYLSMEFLVGRLLEDAVANLSLTEEVRAALASLGIDLCEVAATEPDAALGNGGLGRLAACFMDSMASLGLPAHGYGIRYDYGIFRQVLAEGVQHEVPEDWLAFGNPWEFERPDLSCPVGFGGHVEEVTEEDGAVRHVWHPAETVTAVPYDTPVVGWRGRRVNTLRLWSARAPSPLDLDAFNRGDHVGATAGRARAEAISRVLYPSDESPAGRELRLRQEYFFTSASLRDLMRRHPDPGKLHEHAAVQLNDTHPALAVAELMRLLVDEKGIGWEQAWTVTRETLSYTNHTLLPEALETWPVKLMERLLPRHMEIIYLINWHSLQSLEGPRTEDFIRSVSLIDETNGRRVRMGHLAFLGSHKVNGVSALHTDLMRETVFRDLASLHPGRIVNKTNGITFRRWLQQANPGLTAILVDVLGPGILDDPGLLAGLAAHEGDPALRERLRAARARNKIALARLIEERAGTRVDPSAIFDVQVKRIHEYKRQLLNLVETAALYEAIRAEPHRNWTPRVKIMAGKAAPSYHKAKLIIRLAHDLGRRIEEDPSMRGRLKLVFLPNYNVSLAERIVPAADLSEQISTAGMEASGTGNMKFALNGALTIGTLDGANVEIREHVGPDNITIFGLTAPEVAIRRSDPDHGRAAIARSPRLASALHLIRSGGVSPDEKGRYAALVDGLSDDDAFMVTDDFDAYWEAQRGLDALWADQAAWWRRSIANTAGMAWFSSDRTIREYAQDIWRMPVE